LERTPSDSDLAVTYDWIKRETDPRAVFIIDPRDPFTICGNTAELPAMTKRAIFTEQRKHYIAQPYADSKLRFDIALRSVSGDDLKTEELAYLTALTRPIFVLTYNSSSAERMRSRYGEAKFSRGEFSIYQITLPSN
jgi:hypothetical protein